MTPSHNVSFLAPGFTIERPHDAASERAVRSQQRLASTLVLVLFTLVVTLLPLFFYTYWVILEAAVKAWNLPRTAGLLTSLFRRSLISPGGWPFDVAFVLSTLTAWGTLYLGYDRIFLLGSRAVESAILRKARTLRGDTLETYPRFFVEMRPPDEVVRVRRDRLMPDVGWLFLTPEALVFIGNEQVATIPRKQIQEANRSILAETPRFDLSASWVRLPHGSRRGDTTRLMVRDDAARLSDTEPGARRLAA
ncbi:MAG: hypothetical protein H7Z41_00400, partial [Cytophagales bacterium]|nr:hypothetical protein [Armatimonadota bacterium]